MLPNTSGAARLSRLALEATRAQLLSQGFCATRRESENSWYRRNNVVASVCKGSSVINDVFYFFKKMRRQTKDAAFRALQTTNMRIAALQRLVYNFSDEAWIESVRVQLRAKLDYRTTRQARRFDEFAPNTSFFLIQLRISNESFTSVCFRHASIFVTVIDANQRESTTRIMLNEAQLDVERTDFAVLFDELFQVPLQTRYGKVEGFLYILLLLLLLFLV